jgi:hypothetical protein
MARLARRFRSTETFVREALKDPRLATNLSSLISAAKEKTNVTEADVKAVIWELISNGVIERSSSEGLKLVARTKAAAA